MSDRWAHVGALFDAALAVPASEREAFVRASGEPDDIQREALSLLASHEEAGTFLETRLPTEAPPPLVPGTTIGTYRIVRVLGQGGMGIVYEAEDTRLHRRVALKSIAPAVTDRERLRLRLRHEARAAAALSHPGIATIYALEEIDDQIYIASEYVDGHTLREEIARGPMPLARACATLRDIAAAVASAHERGIVHRDLKPENVLRTRDGGIKILDFGLAQVDPSARVLLSATQLTASGLVAGTPPYMAPEQLLGRATDARADVFALGVMFHEMLTGSHPFGGGCLPSTIARVLAAEPEPLPADGRVPDAIAAIVARALRRDASERFASGAALAAAIEVCLDAPGERAASQRTPSTAFDALAPVERSSARWWWQFHQLAAALAGWGMLWPAWHAHDWLGAPGLPFFLLTLIGTIVSANLRLHLWFTSRIYPAELATQRENTATWIRGGDILVAGTLLAGGIQLGSAHGGWSALLIAFAVGSAVAFLIIEPATARAAFAHASRERT